MAKKTVWDLALNISGKGTEASQAIRTVKKQLEDLKGAADQLGKDWKNFTGNATKLALGFTGGVVAATAGVVSMANSFAEAGDKAAKTSAALGIGVEAYQELTYAMGQSGLSAQEFDSALQKFNLTVRQGAAGNEAMQKQLAAVGLSARKLAEMKPEQALERISDYMQTLPSDAERTRAAVTLFGKTAGPKMMAAMAQGSEGLKQLSQEARDLGIVISDEQAKQSVAYASALTRLKESVTGFKNQFIGSAIGPLTEAFDHLKDAVVEQMPAIREVGKAFGQWLGDAVKRLPEIIAKIKEFGSWVKNTVMGVKDFVGGWKNLAKILAGLAIAPTFISGLKTVFSLGELINTAMKNLPKIMAKMGLAAGPTVGALLPIIGIIAGIAAVIYTVVKNFDTLKQYALDCFKRIAQAFSGGTGEITVDWKKIKEAAMTVLTFIEKTVLVVIKTAMNVITSAIQIAVGALKVLWGVVQTGWAIFETGIKIITALFRGDLSGVIEAVSSLFTRLDDIGQGMFDGLRVIASGFGDFFKNFFEDIFEFVKNIFGLFGVDVAGIFNNIKSYITEVTDWFKSGFSNAVNFVWENIKGVFSGMGSWFADKFNAAKEAIKGAFTGVIDWVKNNWKSIVLFIINPFAGVFKYLYDNFEGFRNVVNNVVSAIKGFFERGIDSIKNIFFGAIDGIRSAWQGFSNFISGLWDGIVNVAMAVWDGLRSWFSGLVEGIKNIWNGITGFFSGLWEAIKQGPAEAIEYVKNAFFGLFNSIQEKLFGFINKIKEGWETVKGFFGGIGDKIGGLFGNGKTIDIAAHASGGIFTQPHIAQIAEQGAEAVVPLNNSPGGLDIWKQAGELGGYVKTASEQSPAISAAASVSAATPPVKTPESSPVMAAAAQRISSGDTTVRLEFKMTNNFNGGTPDGETINQISAAGQKAGEDFESKVRSVFESIMRDRRRVSYG